MFHFQRLEEIKYFHLFTIKILRNRYKSISCLVFRTTVNLFGHSTPHLTASSKLKSRQTFVKSYPPIRIHACEK